MLKNLIENAFEWLKDNFELRDIRAVAAGLGIGFMISKGFIAISALILGAYIALCVMGSINGK